MKVEKKKAREEDCVVNVISWIHPSSDERWVLLVRRPDTGKLIAPSRYLSLTVVSVGLLAGLHEFPTIPVAATDRKSLDSASSTLKSTYIAEPSSSDQTKSTDAGSVLHIYSHIRMTYHVRRTVLSSSSLPELRQPSESEIANLLPDAQLEADDTEDSDDEAPAKKRKTKKGPVKAGKIKSQSSTSKSSNQAPRVRWVRSSDVENEKYVTPY